MPNRQPHKEWVTTQECLGIPGFPGTAANVRKKLELLATGNPTLKRKREGSKAYEYHISLLPGIARAWFGADAQSAPQPAALPRDTCQEQQYWWEAIWRALADDEREKIIRTFQNSGKHGIFTPDMLVTTADDGALLSRSALQTARVLEALSEAERKEILARYGIAEQSSAVAPDPAPQNTKKAG